ncbi:hypothetical protein PAXRUDRAFT_670604 [Paxillus rubicundulus Ve08.2h10]|uniref:Uncharacterized protein n=1 Tax=Paxillus rubicundulus Ve08.2h10 TaxID=930991 RepID=A0A0D0E8H9_9AGAM|nr:hypothetical protein PAXRUDRAFT_670604 [Paxillus rubicundulus Ve08.2h10]
MPHKRAKRSVRERGKALQDIDLAPKIAIEREPIPKSVSRVLDAGRIRREYREKKRKLGGDNDEDNPRLKKRRHNHNETDRNVDGETKGLKIKPGETVAHFNKRVEATMMPLIKTALQQSSAKARKIWKEESSQEAPKPDKKGYNKSRHQRPETSKGISVPPPAACADEGPVKHTLYTAKEFQVTSTAVPRRLNDIAQEPPEIKKIPRGATKSDRTTGVLSMAQKAMMDEEREKAIKHYRELKARKVRDPSGAKLGRVDYGNNSEAPS